MKYNYDTRRKVVKDIREGLKQNKSFEDIVKKIKYLQGSVEEQQQLFNDCKEYIEIKRISNMGIKYQEESISLAEKYLAENPNAILVKEALLTSYMRITDTERSKRLGMEILEEEPNSFKSISKMLKIYLKAEKYEEIEKLIEFMQKTGKKDLVLFCQLVVYFKRSNQSEKIVNLSKKTYEHMLEKIDFPIAKANIRNLEKINSFLQYLIENDENDNNQDYEQANYYIEQIARIVENQLLAKSECSSICNNIDNVIANFRGSLELEELYKMAEGIEDETLKLIQICQIAKAYNVGNIEISNKINKFPKGKELSDAQRKEITLLKNYMASKMSRQYIHDDWIRMKQRYIKKLQIPNKEETEQFLS